MLISSTAALTFIDWAVLESLSVDSIEPELGVGLGLDVDFSTDWLWGWGWQLIPIPVDATEC